MLPSKPVTFLVVHAAAVELYFWGGACQATAQGNHQHRGYAQRRLAVCLHSELLVKWPAV